MLITSAKVLIVENEAIISMNIKSFLTGKGYTVTGTVLSGEKALESIEQVLPDVILMNVFLSGSIDGIETANKIKKIYDIPIIYLTAYSDDSTLKRIMKTDPYGFLVKPVSQEELISAIEIALYKFKMDKKLKEVSDNYRALFDHSIDCIYIHDFDGNFTDFNNAALNLIGYSRDDIPSLNFASLLDEEQIKKALAAIEEIKEHGHTRKAIEFRLKSKNGDFVAVEVTAILIYNDNRAANVLGIAHDITDRRRAEDELRKSEEKFRGAFDHSITAMTLVNTQGRFISVNKATCDILGYSSDEILNMTFPELTHPDDIEISKVNFNNLLSGEHNSYRFEKKFLHKNGSTIWGDVSVALIGDNKGRPLYTVAQFTDITEEKKAREEQQETERRLRRASQLARLGYWDWDIKTDQIVWSKEVYTIFGQDPDRFHPTAEYFESTIHPDDMKAFTTERKRALAERDDIRIDHRIVLPDGSITHIHELAEIIKNSDNDVIRVSGIVQDITERKINEEKIKASIREKETLLQEIHHRVKNNFQIILSLLNLQGSGLNGPEAKDFLFDTANRVRAMARVHESLYQSGNMDQIDMGEFLKKLVTEIMSLYRSENKNVIMSLYSDKIFLSIKKAIPCSILVNELISNIYKHAFENREQGEITVELRKGADSNSILKVSDNGIGISEKRMNNGKTLGIAIIKALTEQLGGELNRNVENGTTFEIDFPMN